MLLVLLVNEKVSIVNNNNGERFETYTIAGERGSGVVCLNGTAARKDTTRRCCDYYELCDDAGY